MYIYCHYTIALSLIALELWPKMSFSLDFRQKIRHFDLVTIATSLPISVLLLIYTHSHSGYMISAFCEPYTRLWPRRSSKTFIFGENHATPQLQRPISPKTSRARSNLTSFTKRYRPEFSNGAIPMPVRPIINFLYGQTSKNSHFWQFFQGCHSNR